MERPLSVYLREHVICDVLAKNMILNMVRSGLGEDLVVTHLIMGKACELHGVTRFGLHSQTRRKLLVILIQLVAT